MVIRWPEIITPRAWLRRVVNGRRGGPPASHAALLLSCLMLLWSCLAVRSKAILSRPQSHFKIAPKVHLALNDGEGSECWFAAEVHRQLLLFRLCGWPGLQSWRGSPLCISSASPTCAKPIALTCHQCKLLHGDIQSSNQCCISSSASLPTLEGLRLVGQALGYELPLVLHLPWGSHYPHRNSLGTTAWQLSPAVREEPTNALKAKSFKFGK